MKTNNKGNWTLILKIAIAVLSAILGAIGGSAMAQMTTLG